jgi:hypothetical protein
MNAYLLTGIALLCFGLYVVSPRFFPPRNIREHTGVPKNIFVSILAAEGIPESISSAVYDRYEEEAHCKTFHPSPEMDICFVFNYDPEEIDEAAEQLLNQLHLEPPLSVDCVLWAGGEVRTARDLARWLHWASQHQPA